MKKNADPAKFAAACKRYCDMMAEGKGTVAALEATGLSHAQADLAWYADPRNTKSPVAGKAGTVKLPEVPGKDEPGYEVAVLRCGMVIVELRDGHHAAFPGVELSYGMIAVAVGLPESRVRKLFTASGIDSAGTRIGKGGRWLDDDPRLYGGNRKGIGTESVNPRAEDRAKLKATEDKVQSVLPKAVERLRAEVGGGVAKKARATKRTTKKAAAPTK